MIRALIFLTVLVALSLAVAWVIEQDGGVAITWMGYYIEARVATLIFGVLALVASAVIGVLVMQTLLGAPSKFLRLFNTKNATEKGLLQLTHTLTALAEGDSKRALAAAHKSEQLLPHQPIATLFVAEAARRSGHADEAEEKFTALLGTKSTEFLGLKGLLSEATRRGDTKEALIIAQKAQQKFPRATGILPLFVGMYKQQQQWSEMLHTLASLEKSRGFFSGRKSEHHLVDIKKEKALALFMRSRSYVNEQRKDEAVSALKDSRRLHPEFLPTNLALLDALMETGHMLHAGKLLKELWKQHPHAELSRRFFTLHSNVHVRKHYKLAEQLVSNNPHHFESHRLLADAALEAEMFVEARKYLRLALEERETTSLCNLMAELEDSEGSAEEAARWRKRASNSYMDASWACQSCGHRYSAWEYRCTACGAEETIAWENSHRILSGGSMKYQPKLSQKVEKPIWEEV